jgi:GTP-binding nuclear protein Ran
MKTITIALVGRSGCGKTSMINRFKTGDFSSNDCGSSFKFYLRDKNFDEDSEVVSDSDYIECVFVNVLPGSPIPQTDCVFWMYDCGSNMEEIMNLYQPLPNSVIVATKCDLYSRKKRWDLVQFAINHGINYFHTSYKSNYNFEKPFMAIIEKSYPNMVMFY